ncbi:flavin reductase family protein [Sphingosinithalassobacter portus]|uniref:flavin reductase family protein n=1 Tax=Stakelama portus TaxID=2676234 RepID=UPI000D6E3215|nr:flavin reductase family protein [Sphingosinithalassobacter portus]
MHQPLDPESFRQGMARLGAAVSIVTTDGPAGRSGLTVTAVCSVTADPPMLLVCVNRTSRSFDVMQRNGNLAVNVLRSCHETLAGRFSSSSLSQDERFALAEWETHATGAPVLSDALVSFDCRIVRSVAVGSHSVLYCAIQRVVIHDEEDGLYYFSRNFRRLTPEDPALPA